MARSDYDQRAAGGGVTTAKSPKLCRTIRADGQLVDGRTTITGQVAWAITAWLVDPSSNPVNPPRPRLPTTIDCGCSCSGACPAYPSRQSAARPRKTCSSTCTSGYLSHHPASCSESTARSSCDAEPSKVMGRLAKDCLAQPSKAISATRFTPRTAASSKANATAASLCAEPSTPTRTGPPRLS